MKNHSEIKAYHHRSEMQDLHCGFVRIFYFLRKCSPIKIRALEIQFDLGSLLDFMEINYSSKRILAEPIQQKTADINLDLSG